jgi:hypothetical protein
VQSNINLLLCRFDGTPIQGDSIVSRISLLANHSKYAIDTYTPGNNIFFTIPPGTKPGLSHNFL